MSTDESPYPQRRNARYAKEYVANMITYSKRIMTEKPHIRTLAGMKSRTGSAGKQRIRDDAVKQKERRVDALALRAEEGRDKLRKASGRSKYPLIRGYPNGETPMSEPHGSVRQSITYGGEPGELKHLSSRRKRKKPRSPK